MIRTAFALILMTVPATAQSVAERSQIDNAPKTQLEVFNESSGAVIIKEYTETGIIRSTGTVAVTAVIFRNAGTGAESKGLIIETKQPTGYSTRDARSFIDYDEIDGMLSGIDYIAATDLSIAKLANFEASFRSRGNVKIVVFNQTTGKNAVAIEVGSVSVSAFLKIEELAKFRELIVAAKNILDNPNSTAAKGDRARKPIVAPPVIAAETPSQQKPSPLPAAKKKPAADSANPFPKPKS